MSLFFNMLTRLVIAFLPRSKCFLISRLWSTYAVILESRKQSLTLFPLFSHLFAMKWWHRIPWSLFFECWVLNQHFWLSSFTFIKRLFNYSLLSAIRVVSSAYLRLLMFLPAVLIPACTSSSLAFCMMYSAYKLNMQGGNIQPWCTLFPVWNSSVVQCLVLTVASGPAYRFLMRQIRWSIISISLRIFHTFLWSTQWKILV